MFCTHKKEEKVSNDPSSREVMSESVVKVMGNLICR